MIEIKDNGVGFKSGNQNARKSRISRRIQHSKIRLSLLSNLNQFTIEEIKDAQGSILGTHVQILLDLT